jgi:UDP-glucuronate 4-epimerase
MEAAHASWPISPKLQQSKLEGRVKFVRGDILDLKDLKSLPKKIDAIVHLAAKAGVRASLEDPCAYIRTNIEATARLLEFARVRKIRQFVFASSSSVYGDHALKPWRESAKDLSQLSPYAVTKQTGENLGKIYSKLYKIRFIALRLFSVYGPGQRPELAIAKFTNRLRSGLPIEIYGVGDETRDYTHVQDVATFIEKAIRYRKTDFEIINIGTGKPVSLNAIIRQIEHALGARAKIIRQSRKPGDAHSTHACTKKVKSKLGARPSKDVNHGIADYVKFHGENRKFN